jgi:ATP-binding protein involved in chromosome partitioning
MISKLDIVSILNPLILSSETKISEVIIKENIISFSIYADKGLANAQKIKDQAENILKERYPDSKILIAITNNRPTSNDNNQPKGSQITIPGVKKIILISSGKGGVGKSTISAYLAKYLVENGKKVGLADADIYGPSIPRIVGLENFIPQFIDGKIVPAEVDELKVMSIGFLAKNDGAFAWRGPMVTKAITQIFSGVAWGALDYLIVDTPPGTGDIHISILSNYKIDGAFIITIPSELSADDVTRCIDLHQKFNTNIYGIIENMSYYYDKNLNQKIALFGEGAGKKLAQKFNLPLIGSVELVNNLSGASFCQITNRIKINLANIDL